MDELETPPVDVDERELDDQAAGDGADSADVDEHETPAGESAPAAGDDDQGAELEPAAGDVDDELDPDVDDELEPDDESAGDVDDELDPDERAVLSQPDAEQVLKQLSRKADSYVKGIVKLLGPELGGYAQCASCDGFPPGLVILEAVDDDRRKAVSRQLGLIGSLDDFVPDEPFFHRCETCKGMGRVLTGSKVIGRETAECRTCHGTGYESQRPAPVAAIANGAEPPAPEPADTPGERPPFDAFGTPSWHADYGKMLDMREVPVAHWAANLDPAPAS